MVEIFEFSTGVKADQTADGKWFSRGFTGVYLNNTFPDQVVPEAIDRAIKNKLFEFPESCYPKSIAMVGRLIGGEVPWSVLAVATRGNDEPPNPRFFTAYRYYAVQDDGDGNGLFWILGWLEGRLQRQQKLVFDPFVVPVPQDYHFDAMRAIKPQANQFNAVLEQQPEAYVVHKDVLLLKPSFQFPVFANKPKLFSESYLLCALAQMNYLQTERQYPLAWAYQVVRVAKPGAFSVIHISDADDIPLIQKSLDTVAFVPTSINIDERAVKIAIKNLTGKVSVKREDVQTLETLRLNPQVEAAVWEGFFEAEGSTKAASQKIYSPQMFRLLPLEVRFLPDRLPRFMRWLADAPEPSRETSLQFMQAYRDYGAEFDPLPSLRWLIMGLLSGATDPKLVVWLLSSAGSFWEVRDVLVEALYADFHNVLDAALDPAVELHTTFVIWQPLQRYLQDPRQIAKEYKPLTDVLFELEKISPTEPGSKANVLNALLANVEQGGITSKTYVRGFPKKKNNYRGFNYSRLIPVHRQLAPHEAAFLVAQGVGEVINGFFHLKLVRILAVVLASSATLALILKAYARFDGLPGSSLVSQIPGMAWPTPELEQVLDQLDPEDSIPTSDTPRVSPLNTENYPVDGYNDAEVTETLNSIREIVEILEDYGKNEKSYYLTKFLEYLDHKDANAIPVINTSSNNLILNLINNEPMEIDNYEASRVFLYQAIYAFQGRNTQALLYGLSQEDVDLLPDGRITDVNVGTGRYIMCEIAKIESFADDFETPCPENVGELQ